METAGPSEKFVTIYQTTRFHTTGNNLNSHRYENLESHRPDVPVHNQAPQHEDPRKSGGIAPRILNLGIRRG
jgi:hypothetical protein